jgi:hypothetical protein
MSSAPAFDILRIEADGAVIWYDAAATLQAAKSRVRALGALEPQAFIIRNQLTRAQLIVPPGAFTVKPRARKSRPLADTALPPYHICRIEKDHLRCVESAESLSAAADRVKILSTVAPGEYLVLDYNPEPPARSHRVIPNALQR